MDSDQKFIPLQDLEVYQLACELSDTAWKVYGEMDWQIKKIIGDQFITSVDSVGANLAEGYGRFHYLDRIKFYYNARGSLLECKVHWLERLYKRKLIDKEDYTSFKEKSEKLRVKLNNFIQVTYKSKEGK